MPLVGLGQPLSATRPLPNWIPVMTTVMRMRLLCLPSQMGPSNSWSLPCVKSLPTLSSSSDAYVNRPHDSSSTPSAE